VINILQIAWLTLAVCIFQTIIFSFWDVFFTKLGKEW